MTSTLVPVILMVLLGIGFTGFGVWAAGKSAARIRERARSLAAELGFDCVEGGPALAGAVEAQNLEGFTAKAATLLTRLLATTMPWRLEGRVEDFRVTIRPETRSSGKSSTTYTIVEVFLPSPLPYKLRVAKEGLFTKLGKALFGLSDVEVGDPAFDPLVRIKAEDPLAARLLLGDEEAKRAFTALLESVDGLSGSLSGGAYADQEKLHWEKVGYHLDPAQIGAILELLVPAAKALARR